MSERFVINSEHVYRGQPQESPRYDILSCGEEGRYPQPEYSIYMGV